MTNETGANRLATGDRHLIAVIGDQDSVTGMLLAGIGNVDSHQKRNFHIVDTKTSTESIEEAFKDFTSRRDVAIVLINQHVANRIRHLLESYHELLPTILEIPSKDHPWDPEKDSVLRKVNRIFAAD